MKLKAISRLLISSLFLSNINISSLASSWSDDGRYETFEGDNFTIDNVLEDDSIDIKIEGNTLINVASYSSIEDFNWLDGEIVEDNYLEFQMDGSGYKNFFLSKDLVSLKPNTEYTYIVDIKENTLVKNEGATDRRGFIFGSNHDSLQPAYWAGHKWLDFDAIGVHSFSLTTKSNFDNVSVADRGHLINDVSGKLKFRYMIIEGNHVGKDIPYFTGMKSSFEDNLVTQDMVNKGLEDAKNIGKYKAEVKVTGKNIFDEKLIPAGEYFYFQIDNVYIPEGIYSVSGETVSGREHSTLMFLAMF